MEARDISPRGEDRREMFRDEIGHARENYFLFRDYLFNESCSHEVERDFTPRWRERENNRGRETRKKWRERGKKKKERERDGRKKMEMPGLNRTNS